MMDGTTPRALAEEFGFVRKLRPQLSRAVLHASLSCAPGDRALSDAELDTIGQRFMRELGFSDAPYVVIRHQDAGPHIHIVACRIDARTGKTISEANDFRRAEAILRDIERDFGLTPVPSSRAALPQQKQRRTPMDENTRKTIQNRLEVASNDAEARLDEMQPHPVMTAECADQLTEREEREQRRFMFSPEYEQTLRTIFGDDIRHIHRTPRSLVIYSKSNGRLHDNGSSLTTYGMSASESARLMVSIAVGVKGWTRIQFSGSREFVMAAMAYAVQQNITVVPRDEEQAAMLRQVLAGGQGSGVLSITPQPVRSAVPPPAPTPHPIQAPAPPQPAFPLPSIFGDEIQRKLDARRRKEEEARLQQPKRGGLMAP